MARQSPCSCGWSPDFSGCTTGPCCDGAADFCSSVKALAADVASTILWALSGRRFGCCEITVRPCRKRDCDQLPLAEMIYWDRGAAGQLGVGFGFAPMLLDGEMFNVSCGCPGACTCDAACEFFLPGPICSITEVKIGDEVIDPDRYVVYDWNRLVFVADEDSVCPPTCQDIAVPAGTAGTWSVRYTLGEPVTTAANLMAGQYACELARALTGDTACRLPRNVQSVARQGIDIAFADPWALAEAGLTGLPEVDLWLRSVNPAQLAERPQVWSPDLPRSRRQT